ncbi:MAG TPA: helix-turn-helix transcriptional regulator [Ignavibacteria bacterium]|nr:helix-turn-helix transcriptional regulator [Ignavibacteria bacterium]
MLKKFAEDLKKQRESLGISLMDIAGETRLHHSIFEKMEKGDFDFQPPTYIKAFLRQYAKILRLNPDDVLKNYDLARQGKYTPKSSSKPEEIQSTETSAADELSDVFESAAPPVTKPDFSETPKKKSIELEDSSAPKRIQADKDSLIEPLGDKRPDFNTTYSKGTAFLKYAGITLLVLLLAAGAYFLVKTVFFEKDTTSKQEIIRNKVDTISTASDMQKIDSIKSAKEKEVTTGDSKLVLKITSKKDGAKIQIATDGKVTDETEVVSMKSGQEREWRAKEFFTIKTKNSNEFKATINDKNIKFKLADTPRLKVSLSDDGKVQIE